MAKMNKELLLAYAAEQAKSVALCLLEKKRLHLSCVECVHNEFCRDIWIQHSRKTEE